MTVVLADTGPLYALADPSDQYHVRAQAELDSIEKQALPLAVSYPTVCEAHTLVLRRLGVKYAGEWLAEVLGAAVLLNPEVADYAIAAVQLSRFADQAITLVDGVSAVMASRLGIPVWTFDRHFTTMRVKIWR
jgi:predicted nucleic acid-binding protein